MARDRREAVVSLSRLRRSAATAARQQHVNDRWPQLRWPRICSSRPITNRDPPNGRDHAYSQGCLHVRATAALLSARPAIAETTLRIGMTASDIPTATG